MEVMEISRQIMTNMDAFKGCKPALHNSEIVIIRGIPRAKLKPEDFEQKLKDLLKELNIKKVYLNSKRAEILTKEVDRQIKLARGIDDEYQGLSGVEMIKQSFEQSGFVADYIVGEYENLAAYVVMWMDKSGSGPMFVETMIIRTDALKTNFFINEVIDMES